MNYDFAACLKARIQGLSGMYCRVEAVEGGGVAGNYFYDRFRLAFDLYRRSFYVDADLRQIAARLRESSAGLEPVDGHVEVYLNLTRNLCSSHYSKV